MSSEINNPQKRIAAIKDKEKSILDIERRAYDIKVLAKIADYLSDRNWAGTTMPKEFRLSEQDFSSIWAGKLADGGNWENVLPEMLKIQPDIEKIPDDDLAEILEQAYAECFPSDESVN